MKLIKACTKRLCLNTDKEVRAAVERYKGKTQAVNLAVRVENKRKESANLRTFEKAAQQLIQLVQQEKLKKDVVRRSKTVQDLWKLLHRKRHPARPELRRRLPASARIRGKRSAVNRNASNWTANIDETSSELDVVPEISGGDDAMTKVQRFENDIDVANSVLTQAKARRPALEVVGGNLVMRSNVFDEGIESMELVHKAGNLTSEEKEGTADAEPKINCLKLMI